MIQAVNKRTISDLFKRNAEYHYYIPKYQREYIWGHTQWDALYDDIQENGNGYFIGSIIYVNSSDAINPQLEVVDGQQRLTTLSLFLAAIYHLLDRLDGLDDDMIEECSALRKSLQNKHSENKLVVVPQIQNCNYKDYNRTMMEAGVIECRENPAGMHRRKIYGCYKHFLGRMESDLAGIEDTPINFIFDTLEKVMRAMVVTIEVSTYADAYMLFESLNDRGCPLSAIDLMKNFIMSQANKNNIPIDDVYEQWNYIMQLLTDDYKMQERFFRHYYNAFKNRLNAPFRNDDVKSEYPLGNVATKSNLLAIYERLISSDLSGFLTDATCCAETYNTIICPEQTDNLGNLYPPLLDLLHVQAAPSYMLLLYLITNKDKLNLQEMDVCDIVKLLVSFFIRRNITDRPGTRDVTRIFMDVIDEIETCSLSSAALLQYIRMTMLNVSATDEEFKTGLEGNIYKDNKDATRFLLCSLAQKRMTKESYTDLWQRNNYHEYVWTIEHILPEGGNLPMEWVKMIANGDIRYARELQTKYVHKLGNLTLTAYNSELSNYTFEMKRDRMDKSHEKYIGYRNGLELNSELSQKNNWRIDDIEKRTTMMISEVLDIFKMQ